jgi:hypothetical protein
MLLGVVINGKQPAGSKLVMANLRNPIACNLASSVDIRLTTLVIRKGMP